MSVISNPKILLLDEHTAALDPKTSTKIMGIIKEIVEDKGITTEKLMELFEKVNH